MASRECACGCGERTKGGDFIAGHDEYVRTATMKLFGPDSLGLARKLGFGPGLRNARAIAEG